MTLTFRRFSHPPEAPLAGLVLLLSSSSFQLSLHENGLLNVGNRERKLTQTAFLLCMDMEIVMNCKRNDVSELALSHVVCIIETTPSNYKMITWYMVFHRMFMKGLLLGHSLINLPVVARLATSQKHHLRCSNYNNETTKALRLNIDLHFSSNLKQDPTDS